MAVLEIQAATSEAGGTAAHLALPALQAAPSAGRDEGLSRAASGVLPVRQAADSDPARLPQGKTVRSAPGAADSAAPREAAQGVPSAEFVPPEAAAHSAEVTQAAAEEVPAAEAPSAAVEEGNFNPGPSGG